MHINAGSITLHEALHDGLDVGLQANIHVWLSHGTISIIGSLVVKGTKCKKTIFCYNLDQKW